jgi:proline iminopeptidase
LQLSLGVMPRRATEKRMTLLSRIAIAWLILMGSGTVGAQIISPAESMERISVGAREVAYHVIGNGVATPLLLINGGPGFDHQYLHLSGVWNRFARSRRVVFFDQFGTGQSGQVTPQDSTSVAEVLAGIEGIRRSLGADRLAVLGHSWGGYLAITYALRHPDRVERLILVETVPPKLSDTEYLFAALFPDSLARGAEMRLDDPRGLREDIQRHFAMSFYSPDTRAQVIRRLAEAPLGYSRRQGALLWAEASARDLTNEIGRVAFPVLVGTGRFDANVSPRTAWRIHQAIPGSRFVVWERSGHYPMVEEPDAFFETLDAFLKGK